MSRFLCKAALVAALYLAPFAADAQGAGSPVSPGLAAQIRDLLQDKAARTPTQRKIGSQLLYAARMARGRDAAPGIRTLRTGIEADAHGRVALDIDADPTPALLARIAELDGTIVHVSRRLGAVRARLPLLAVESLAESPDVRHVRPADHAFTRKADTSEGNVAHRADQLRSTYGVDGTGVTVAVLSDGVDSLASVVATGDLPPGVTVLPGQAGSGDEGTAILEIVHDLAPGASLMFATAFTSQASFADNILALRAAGADIIVDDVGYFTEATFQDDDLTAAVDSVVADGALYFSAAGNGGNLDDGTSGTWEGDFVDGGPFDGDTAQDFGGGAILNEITGGSPYVYTLQWSDPLGGSGNDYDLFLVNKKATVVISASTDTQDGNDDPNEVMGGLPNDVGRNLIATKVSGADRMLQLKTNGGELQFASPGEVSGHPGARGAIAVAATDWLYAGGADGTFDGSEQVETYSSDGPRRIHYEADGTPITPGDFSSTGGELRAKPDLTGADCVSTSTPGFSVFCGTSAAAPHAAAIAALLWQLGAAGGAIPADLRAVLGATAIDIEAPGADRDSGAGIADALAAGDALKAACSNGIDDDGDGFIDLADVGCDDASDASERSTALVCDDGLDDDGDGLVDLADPGCREPGWPYEDPACDNQIDDDGDGTIDFAGLDLNGDLDFDDPGEAPPDPDCTEAWLNSELPPAKGCGLGPELAPVLLAGLMAWRRARRSSA